MNSPVQSSAKTSTEKPKTIYLAVERIEQGYDAVAAFDNAELANEFARQYGIGVVQMQLNANKLVVPHGTHVYAIRFECNGYVSKTLELLPAGLPRVTSGWWSYGYGSVFLEFIISNFTTLDDAIVEAKAKYAAIGLTGDQIRERIKAMGDKVYGPIEELKNPSQSA